MAHSWEEEIEYLDRQAVVNPDPFLRAAAAERVDKIRAGQIADPLPNPPLEAIVAGERWTTAGAKVLAADPQRFTNHSAHRRLCQTRNGGYFVLRSERTISPCKGTPKRRTSPLHQGALAGEPRDAESPIEQAARLFVDMPVKYCSFEEAFPHLPLVDA